MFDKKYVLSKNYLYSFTTIQKQMMIYPTIITNFSLALKCDKIHIYKWEKIVLVYQHTAIYPTGKTNKRTDRCIKQG